MEKTILDTLYIVNNSNNEVSIEIIVGDVGQTGLLTMRLDGEIIAQEHPGNFPTTVLGSNTSLKGKKLSIVANIADASRTTDVTSITICLTGGALDQDFALYKKVVKQGEAVDYACLIEFFSPTQ